MVVTQGNYLSVPQVFGRVGTLPQSGGIDSELDATGFWASDWWKLTYLLRARRARRSRSSLLWQPVYRSDRSPHTPRSPCSFRG
jgi:hypothetical protein